jgi:hypothetical protein
MLFVLLLAAVNHHPQSVSLQKLVPVSSSISSDQQRQQSSVAFVPIREINTENNSRASTPFSGRDTPVSNGNDDKATSQKGREKGTVAYGAEEHIALLCLVLMILVHSMPVKARRSGKRYAKKCAKTTICTGDLPLGHPPPYMGTWLRCMVPLKKV